MTENTWTTAELMQDFTVLGFSYGMCVVERKADGVRGSLTFHRETREGREVRVYSGWVPDVAQIQVD